MTTKPTVLIVGITGMMGRKIANEMVKKGEVNIRALVRNLTQRQERFEPLINQGITLVEGDLFDSYSLLKACEGVDTIVSTVKGTSAETSEKEIILDGQLNLIEAAKKNRVGWFFPSDFSLNYFHMTPGEHHNLDLRRQVATALINSSLNYTFVLNGAFTEVLFSEYFNVFDFKTNTFRYWGDGDTLFDTTTTDDTAKYVAAAVSDPGVVNRPLQVAGDTLTMKQLCSTYETISGKTLKKEHLGSVEDLKAWIEQKKQTAKSHFEYLAQQYIYGMVSGKGKLDQLDNDRYPQIHPITVQQYIANSNFTTPQPASSRSA